MKMSEAVKSEGYGFVVATGNELDEHLFTRLVTREGLEYPYVVVCVSDSWDYAYSVAFQIANHRKSLEPGSDKNVHDRMALILSGWCYKLAKAQESS